MEELVFKAAGQDDEAIGELQVAEYLILLQAFDVFAGFVEETTGSAADDVHTRKGLKLLRLIDAQKGPELRDYLLEKVSRDVSKRGIDRTFKIRVGNLTQASRRALTLRTILTRGGPVTVKEVFSESRARKGIRSALTAVSLEEPATALSQFAAISVRNPRIKAWIKGAKAYVSTGEVQNPVEVAVDATSASTDELTKHQLMEDGASSPEEMQEAQQAQQETLEAIEREATETAKQALEASGEPDVAPTTKSEFVGLVTSVATSVVADIGDPDNIPEALRKRDPEQRAAALTDGRVLIAAGAGSGKSTTLVSRVKYLVEERDVPPGKILVSSFNKKAAEDLKVKIGKAVGGAVTNMMTVGTLHGLFLGAIKKYGTSEEKAMFEGSKQGILTGSIISAAVNRLWRKCFAVRTVSGEMKDAVAPPAKTMRMAVTKWAGNGVSVAEAKARAITPQEQDAARWYEMYEGLKGALPGWQPQCEGRAEAKSEYDRFNHKNRVKRTPSGDQMVRLGDFDDMIKVFLGILKRSPEVRKRAQKAFDHVMIDEAQDMNQVQMEVLELMTEHITDGSDGKSYWMIGDDSQSIYSFRGARPDLFIGLNGKEGWKTRTIRTNYRCAPEVVYHANRLISNNPDRLDIEANAAPSRIKGETSITVNGYGDEAATAVAVASEIKEALDSGTAEISDNAILCRTNKELNSYETALLMQGIPYARKGASSFLSSSETKGFLGYVTLVTDTDHAKMQESLKDVLNTPNRFFVGPAQVARAVDNALNNYARRSGNSKTIVNPMVALRDQDFQRDLVSTLKGTPSGFKFQKGMEALRGMVQSLDELGVLAQDDGAKTKDMFDAILDMPGVGFRVDPNTGRIQGERVVTFREELNANIKDFGGDEDEKEEEDPDTMTLGNISFLYELAKPNPEDPGDREISPETPKGFWAKMGRLTEKAKELRIDIDKWEKNQEDKFPPEDRRPPPGVYLATVHATKGAQWPNVFVQMPRGRFPMVITDPEDPESASKAEADLQSERRLAYVALTRPSKNLRVVYPSQYQGKPAGPSPFLSEAGLVEGENIGIEEKGSLKTALFIEDLPEEEAL